jgi:hypothetical protein
MAATHIEFQRLKKMHSCLHLALMTGHYFMQSRASQATTPQLPGPGAMNST